MKRPKCLHWQQSLLVLNFILTFALTASAQNYFPLEDGNRWELESNAGGKYSYTVSVEDGSRVLTTNDQLLMDVDKYFVSVDSGGIKLHKAELNELVAGIGVMEFSSPQVFYPPSSSFQLEAEWTISGPILLSSPVRGGFKTISIKIVGTEETVETSIGRFDNCVKLQVTSILPTPALTFDSLTYQWLAPDFGPVKYESSAGIEYTLTKVGGPVRRNLPSPNGNGSGNDQSGGSILNPTDQGNGIVPEDDFPVERSKATTLSILSGYGQEKETRTGLDNPFVVEVLDQYGNAFPGATITFSITRGGGTVSPSTAPTDDKGRAQTTLTLGSSAGVNVVEARVTGIDRPQIFTATAIAPPESPIPTTLERLSGNEQTGQSGTTLAQPFIVGVKDRNGKAFKGATVTFRVLEGKGGFPLTRMRQVKTDAYGRASVRFRLGSNVGIILVGATLTSTGEETVTFSAVAKSDTLPVMYWIESGKIFRKLPGVSKNPLELPEAGWTATSLAVDITGNKIYWTEQNTNKKGRIRSASLSGANAKTLKVLPNGVANGIVANPVTRRLYWTNSRGKIGKIQSIGFNGEDFEGRLITDLGMPEHIALDVGGDVADGMIYWTAYNDGTWGIWRSSPDGNIQTKQLLDLGELGELRGVAVTGNKLYWAEKTVAGQGKIRCASITGRSVKTLHVLEGSIPLGIAVDAAGSRLYWTSDSGSVQRLNLDEPIQIVAIDLKNPTGIALGSVLAAAAPARPAAPPTIVESSDQNALLANYPNPFNPETWIPYQLSEARDVTVSIYSVNGQLVRHLDLGHQAAGVYRSRSRAAYWDGRNAFGERVASGLYFYTLTAGDFTATRKMLIRK